MSRLVRLLADPALIRVGVCRVGNDKWQVSLSCIHKKLTPIILQSNHPTVEPLVRHALRLAEIAEWPGIDLDLQWTYEHPQSRNEHEDV